MPSGVEVLLQSYDKHTIAEDRLTNRPDSNRKDSLHQQHFGHIVRNGVIKGPLGPPDSALHRPRQHRRCLHRHLSLERHPPDHRPDQRQRRDGVKRTATDDNRHLGIGPAGKDNSVPLTRPKLSSLQLRIHCSPASVLFNRSSA